MNPTRPSPPAETRLDAALLRTWPLPADGGDDKRGRGTVLIVGGSVATPGAVLLAGIAALRAGAGRLQLATAAAAAPHVAVLVPESIVVPFDGPDLDLLLAEADSVVVGPGLLDDDTADALMARVLDQVPPQVPLVVDALALGAWAGHRDGDRAHVVLTPNREELAQLVGTGSEGAEPEQSDEPDRALAMNRQATVASFGRVVLPDGRVLADRSSPPGLGTSGSGDVLAGIVGGLAARCGDGPQAAAWGLFVHAAAAHRLARRLAPSGYLARELADEVAPALHEIDRPPPG